MAWAWPWAKADQKDFPQLALFCTAVAFHAVHGQVYWETAMKLNLSQTVIAIAAVIVCLSSPLNAEAIRDGAHDFDFARGTWHTHITRVLDPFAGGTHTVTMDGTKTARPVWNGRAWLEEIEADGPDGHWEGATFFLYNPKSGQWSQQYIDSASGDFEPPTIGSFKDGRAEFFATTQHEGRVMLVRGVWSDITASSHRYEISYSQDGGRTWMAAFKAYLTRIKD
jgi:hypothetical protein